MAVTVPSDCFSTLRRVYRWCNAYATISDLKAYLFQYPQTGLQVV